ncbi:MAG: CoA transferase, partial [Burkholderiaceae bacterium]|nr:CoA transferase [Burkholderiaceae bacterium]
SVTGEPDRAPVFAGDSIGDTVSGLFAAWAICAALFQRERTGRGRRIDVAMFDSLFALLPTALAAFASTGEAPGRQGRRHPYSAPFGVFRASDGDFVLAVANDTLFRQLAKAIDRADLLADPRFARDSQRGANEAALRAEIERWSRRMTVAQVVDALLAGGVPAAPVQSVKEAAQSAHARHRGLFPEVAHPTLGSLPLPEQPVHFAGAARGALRPAPALGADSDAILAEVLELDTARISRLRSDGVI